MRLFLQGTWTYLRQKDELKWARRRATSMATRFYAALAHTDTVAYYDRVGERRRVSNTNLLQNQFDKTFCSACRFQKFPTTGGASLDLEAVAPDGTGERQTIFVCRLWGLPIQKRIPPRLRAGRR